MTTVPIGLIDVGERSRTALRNLTSLANSIRENGLLQPLVVAPVGDRYRLVCGARRLAALRSESFDEAPVTVVASLADELAALQAEGDENTEREPFTPEEAVRHRKRIETIAAARAKERQGTRTDLQPSPKLAEGAPRKQRETRTVTAKGTGYSATTLDKAEAVVNAAEDDTQPEAVRAVAREAKAEMNRTGKVDGAAKKVERAKAAVINLTADAGTTARLRRIENQQRWAKAMRTLTQVAVDFPPDDIRDWLDASDVTSLELSLRALNGWAKQVKAARSGLRLVGEEAK